MLGWEHDERLGNRYARLLPGGLFRNPDGSPSQVKHLHVGIFNPADPRPSPADPAPALPPPGLDVAATRI